MAISQKRDRRAGFPAGAVTAAAWLAVAFCVGAAPGHVCAAEKAPDSGAKAVTVQWDASSKAPWLASVGFEPIGGTRIVKVEKMADEGAMQGRRVRISVEKPARKDAPQPGKGPAKKPAGLLWQKPGFVVRLAGDRGFRVELQELETIGFMWLKPLGMFVSAAGSWEETAPKRQAMEREAAANAKKPFRSLFEKRKTFRQDFKGPPAVFGSIGGRWGWAILRRGPYWPLEPRATQQIALMPEADFDYFAKRLDPGLEWKRGNVLCMGWEGNVKEFESSHDRLSLPERHWRFSMKALQSRKRAAQLEAGYHLIPTFTRLLPGGAAEEDTTYVVIPREPGPAKAGNDPLLLHARMTLVNNTDAPRKENVQVTPLLSGKNVKPLQVKDGHLQCPKGILCRIPTEFTWKVSPVGYHKGDSVRLEADVTVPARGKKVLDFVWSDDPIAPEHREKLARLSFDEARKAARAYWDAFIARGASVHVPDPRVLNRHLTFRPRGVIINDRMANGLLYTPTSICSAYDGRCWPTCTAPGIGYSFAPMGYFDVAREMLEFLITNQRSSSGAFTGAHRWYAHNGWVQWAAARYYMLSRDKAFIEKHLEALLGSLRYTKRQRAATKAAGADAYNYGCLPPGAVTDGDKGVSGIFSEAPCWLGMKSLAEVLSDLKHPAAEEWRREAEAYRADTLRAYRRCMRKKRPVRLNDGTYVIVPPGYLEKPEYEYGSGRWLPGLLDGAYMSTLETGILAGQPEEDWIIQHVNDNLCYTCIGLADEPFYCGHLNAHLRRDEVKHFIYTFYSLVVNGFNLHLLTTYEHSPAGKPELTHWAQGHYDDALFSMLCRQDGKTLRLCQATPRRWLEDGKEIRLERYYTDFGPISFSVVSRLKAGRVEASIDPPTRNPYDSIVLRLRVPGGRKMKKVTVNGAPHKDFHPEREEIVLPPRGKKLLVVAEFEPEN